MWRIIMKYNISVSDKNTYLHIRVNEAVTPELLHDFITETAQKSNEYGIENFLFDLQQSPNQVSAVTHYEFVYQRSKELGFKPASKHALLVDAEGMDVYSFVETLLVNAGYQGKMFVDKFAAIEWLEQKKNH